MGLSDVGGPITSIHPESVSRAAHWELVIMARMLTTRGTRLASEVLTTIDEYSDARWCCQQLESGQILYLPRSPVYLSDEDRHYLVSLRQDDSRLHKNISYRPAEGMLRGFASSDTAETDRMRGILRAYSDGTTRLLTGCSRRMRANGRSISPASGRSKSRGATCRCTSATICCTSTPFPAGRRAALGFCAASRTSIRLSRACGSRPMRFPVLAATLRPRLRIGAVRRSAIGGASVVGSARPRGEANAGAEGAEYSPYDRFMLRFHDYLKENEKFQQGPHKVQLEFAPGSTWIVFTDSVPHAVLSGRFALEQTYLVNEGAMTCSQCFPLRILEKILRPAAGSLIAAREDQPSPLFPAFRGLAPAA